MALRTMGDVWAEHGHRDVPCSPADAVHGKTPCRIRPDAEEAPETVVDVLRSLGRRVRETREQRGLSYRGAARASGVQVATLLDIEHGLVDVRVSTAVRLLEWIDHG